MQSPPAPLAEIEKVLREAHGHVPRLENGMPDLNKLKGLKIVATVSGGQVIGLRLAKPDDHGDLSHA